MTHHFSPEILKEGDIRGVFGTELKPRDGYFIGRCFGTVLNTRGKESCVLGRDGRLSSPELHRQALQGLIDAGIAVFDIGVVPTPAVYHAVFHLRAQAGMMITASHNPPEYNGFKFITDEGTFHGEEIQGFAALAASGEFTTGEGSVTTLDLTGPYTAYLHSFLDIRETYHPRVVWDPGNGAAAAVLPQFLTGLPGEHRVICGEVDGTFPHHHPDPSIPKNVEMLARTVRETGAGLGIAFDGDGDRIGVVDGEGVLLYGDQLLVLYAQDYLTVKPGAAVMSEVKSSQFFYDEVAARGGRPVMWKVGHTNQKQKMREDDIGLAGETSGHIFFAENRGYDDALFAAVKLLNLLSRRTETLTEIRKAFPVYHDSGEIRIALDTAARNRVIAEIRERLAGSDRPFVGIDGIRAPLDMGFWMLRSSQTQPHLTIRVEAARRATLEAGLKELRDQLRLSGVESGELP